MGNDGMLFGMRCLPCMIVWPFMAQWCVCVCVCVFDMRWKIFEGSTVCVSLSHLALGSTCLSWVLCVCPACFDRDNVHTGVYMIGLGYWNGQLNHT